jgi:hypothetical protein
LLWPVVDWPLCEELEELRDLRERFPLVVVLSVVLWPVLLGELIWSVVDCPVALVPVCPVADALPAGFADVGAVGSLVVPAVAGGVLDGIFDGEDDCAYAKAPPARTVLSAIELIVSNFVELIVYPSLWGLIPPHSDGAAGRRAAATTHDSDSLKYVGCVT